MTNETANGKYEPAVRIAIGLLVVGIAFTLFNSITMYTDYYLWISVDIFRIASILFAIMSMAPLKNGIVKGTTSCLRNCGIFLILTLTIPSMILGFIAMALVYRRGFAHSAHRTTTGGGTQTSRIQYSLVKTCDDDAFEVFPQILTRVDIGKALAIMGNRGYTKISEEVSSCAVEKGGVKTTIYSSGRLMVGTTDEGAASRTAAEIFEAVAE